MSSKTQKIIHDSGVEDHTLNKWSFQSVPTLIPIVRVLAPSYLRFYQILTQ